MAVGNLQHAMCLVPFTSYHVHLLSRGYSVVYHHTVSRVLYPSVTWSSQTDTIITEQESPWICPLSSNRKGQLVSKLGYVQNRYSATVWSWLLFCGKVTR